MNGTAGGRERERERERGRIGGRVAVLLPTKRKSKTIAPMKMPSWKKAEFSFSSILRERERKKEE